MRWAECLARMTVIKYIQNLVGKPEEKSELKMSGNITGVDKN
jgi:hypothetical protein